MNTMKLLALLAALLLAAGCGGEKKEGGDDNAAAADTTAAASDDAQLNNPDEPDYIVVQHLLIGFQGSIPGKEITRTQGEAGVLATKLFERARGGEDFDALVKEYTDDAYPGTYKMANTGIEADMSQRIFPREGMVPAFGDVGFLLQVGEIGMAPYEPVKSPYGWHIIKRVE